MEYAKSMSPPHAGAGDVMVHISYIESQPESNPTIAGRSKKYVGIGRVLIAYGVKSSIDHNCGGTVPFEAKVPERDEHYVCGFGAVPLPGFGGAPRFELSDEAAMNAFITYLKWGVTHGCPRVF